MTQKKNRGGQKNNKNALKHGFYSELLSPAEIARLNKIKGVDLDDEVKLLRSLTYKLAEQIDTKQIEEARKTANTIANIIQVINTTQRTKLLARGGGGEIAQTIMQAIMSLDPYKEL
jgi:hypothetical protein